MLNGVNCHIRKFLKECKIHKMKIQGSIAFVNVSTVGKNNVFVRARIVIANRVSVLVQTVTKIRVNVYVRNMKV